ncbi:hypothetical protein ACSFA0_22705 [Variovorax sp. LT1P1]|uniref:hypothetical protein n=1 Tax=Variovorax sp. LT1P1 TaxID=3443730 RepID=UPI003F465A8C
MFGFNKGLKYIKIRGVLTTQGEVIGRDRELVARQGVTVRDSDGVEVHFALLYTPARLADKVQVGQEATLYVLRYRVGDRLTGAIYAVETQGEKSYFPQLATQCAKVMGRISSTRMRLLRSPMAFGVGAGFSTLALFVATVAAASFLPSSTLAKLMPMVVVAAWVYYLFYPLVQSRAFTGQSIMEVTMREDGFIGQDISAQAAKY